MTSEDLHHATQRLLRDVDSLRDEDYVGPSLLPGWTRAHVVAHLALNAEALTGVLRGVTSGVPVAMYPSAEARDADIDTLAGAGPTALRGRLGDGATALTEALGALPSRAHDVRVERTPGSERTFAAGDVADMRWREVEIHHADLDAGYSRADWPEEFCLAVVDQLAGRAGVTLVATDLGRTWHAGDDAPAVSGAVADLGWWLSGRGSGAGLTSDGELPRIEAW